MTECLGAGGGGGRGDIPEDIVAWHKVFPCSLSSWPIIQKDNRTLHSSNLQSHKSIFLRTDFDYVMKLVPQEAVTTTPKKKKKKECQGLGVIHEASGASQHFLC